MTARTWNDNKRCGECCNGDRCDDPTHFSRPSCPHCKGTGYAIWTREGREDMLHHLQFRCRLTEDQARAELARITQATT